METKKQFRYFTIFECEKEQDYLRKMHQSGWKLVRVSGFCVYHFEKCIPEDVVYQLDYNRDGVAHKDEYVKMFSDCGWEYLLDYVGYSYFRKPASACDGNEEIFCDETSKRQMQERVFKGRILPLFAIFACLLLPGVIRNLLCGEMIIAACFGALTALYLLVFISFARQYGQFKNRP